MNNKQDGWGVHIWLEDKGEGKFLRNRYEGEWKNGLRHGVGVFYYTNGSKYEGEWVENLKDGFAAFTYEDGKIFTGLYKNDKMVPNTYREFKIDNSDLNSTHQIAANQEDSLLRKPLTSTNRGGVGDQSPKRGTKRLLATALTFDQQESKEPLKGNEIESNPYETMLDIADLLVEEDEENAFNEIREVKNLLLRYHGSLKQWYRVYTAKQQTNSEESFALTFKMFWKMLRDARVLSPKVTIASFNRLFMQGNKNNFTLFTDQQTLKKSLFLAKSIV